MNRRFFLGIKGKFVLAAALIVAITSIIWGTWAWHNEKRLLYDRLLSNARSMATSLKTPIVNALIYEEMGIIEEGGLLDNFVDEIVANNDFPTLYAFVTDDKGKVLAHSRYMEYGSTYTDDLTREALQGDSFISRTVLEADTRENILDIAMPLRIYGKSWGSLRIGISMKPLEHELYFMGVKVVSFSVLFFLIGTILFYFVGQTISRPVQNLAIAMSGINPQALTVELPEARNDEIGFLQESISAMLVRLQDSERERQQFFSSLVQSEKLATIGKLVAGVAHEVNNPLNAISSSIYYLEKEPSESVANQTNLLKQGLSRIQKIVQQLSDFSRASNLSIESVQSSAFFQEAATFGSMALKKRAVIFKVFDDCKSQVTVRMDKAKLHQVVLNLIMNAADACGEKGEVRLSATVDDTSYVITVTDDGEGIPEDIKGHIFEIFFTTKQAGKGTGMGLAICRNIIDMHNGTISVASRPGETVFTIRIPLDNEVSVI
ncbi:MAG: ATP-binding protein [Desulfuromonadaceae bacterium]|nr:ATP-binding protein [Desulfuromonadaceae bacterium]MDD5104437.1 ATP-binding protein [Desulfuromonadaceae bacterium]